MLSMFGASALGVLLLGLFGIFYWLNVFATIRAILAFVGTCLLGTAGFLGGLLNTLSHWVTSLANSGTGWAAGVAVGGTLLVFATGFVFVHDLMPKHSAGKRTGWAGIAFAAFLLAGASAIPALNQIPSSITTAVTTVTGG